MAVIATTDPVAAGLGDPLITVVVATPAWAEATPQATAAAKNSTKSEDRTCTRFLPRVEADL